MTHRRLGRPGTASSTQVFRRRIPTELVVRAMAVIPLFLLAFLAFGASTTLLALTGALFGNPELDFIALMVESGSALATDGLSTGITPGLSDAGKLVLIVTMFLGRDCPLTAAYAVQRRAGTIRDRHPKRRSGSDEFAGRACALRSMIQTT